MHDVSSLVASRLGLLRVLGKVLARSKMMKMKGDVAWRAGGVMLSCV